MGKWSTYQRRSASTATSTAPPPPTAPVLTIACLAEVVFLDWTWGGIDPEEWRMEKSHDGIVFDIVNYCTGASREFEFAGDICASGEFDAFYRIIGVDGDRIPIIDPSNIVWILIAEW